MFVAEKNTLKIILLYEEKTITLLKGKITSRQFYKKDK